MSLICLVIVRHSQRNPHIRLPPRAKKYFYPLCNNEWMAFERPEALLTPEADKKNRQIYPYRQNSRMHLNLYTNKRCPNNQYCQF